jgi:hypothetical protein
MKRKTKTPDRGNVLENTRINDVPDIRAKIVSDVELPGCCVSLQNLNQCMLGATQAESKNNRQFYRLFFGWMIWLLFLLTYCHQRNYDYPTPASRLDLCHSLMSSHSVEIDRYHTNTCDKAYFEGHFYSDKAPGTVAIVLPAFAAGVTVAKSLGISIESRNGWLLTSWIACAGGLALVTVLGAGALMLVLRAVVNNRAALVTVLALFLGAAPLPYSTMLFSHSMVVGLICIGLWAMDLFTNQAAGARKTPRQRDVLAGFTLGWALASEFSAGLIIGGIWLYLLRQNWRRAAIVSIAMIPPLLLIPLYSLLCFGNPFVLPYSLQATFPEMQQGLYAIKWPDAETGFKLLFSPARGLLFWTPFLGIAGLGWYQLLKRSREQVWLTMSLPVLHLLVISGRTWDWPAGWVLGPRLLAPMLPLLAVPCAYGFQQYPRLGLVLAAYSIQITTAATLTEACPQFNEYPNPLIQLHFPLFASGDFCPNLGSVLGLSPFTSIGLFYFMLVIGAAWFTWRFHQEDQRRHRLD